MNINKNNRKKIRKNPRRIKLVKSFLIEEIKADNNNKRNNTDTGTFSTRRYSFVHERKASDEKSKDDTLKAIGSISNENISNKAEKKETY